jgi:2-C-methyl-D-erythritol 2,4-cyclodiphosphate synthase
MSQPEEAMRVGVGYDFHRLVPGKRLFIGGCEIPSEVGEEAHSDGDVLLHAVIDALLGASSQEDIGTHFPSEDPQYEGISSLVLLKRTLEIVDKAGFRPSNLDCTVVLEAPKLRPYIARMRKILAKELGLDQSRVSVKAKTKEGMGPVGQGKAVEAYSVVLLESL